MIISASVDNNKVTNSAQWSVPPRYGARTCPPSERWVYGTRVRISFRNSIPALPGMAFLMILKAITATNTIVSAFLRFLAGSRYRGGLGGE